MVPDASIRGTGLARQNAASNRASPTSEPRWRVCLLGAVEAFDGVQRLDCFPSRSVAALARLVWPGVALAVGRNRQRQVLSTLKSMLEPDWT